eukprot:gb/GECG01003029.1/.p1 GENE.gb/GECG01003029.1/~~gb/GECG01003029.1/.p1  ORF type:complete len:114 (+),score=10.59 gb/GECG01003029.1/:1-342(+)
MVTTLGKYGDRKLYREVKAFQHAILLVLDYLQVGAIIGTMKIDPFRGVASGFLEVSSVCTMSPAKATAFRCLTNASPFQTSLTVMGSPLLVACAGLVIQGFVEYGLGRREKGV